MLGFGDIPDDTLKLIGAIGSAIVGVAVVAVIVGRNAQTANVISSGGGALAQVVGAAVQPVSGQPYTGSSNAIQSMPLGALSNPPSSTSNPFGAPSGLFSMPGSGASNFTNWLQWSGQSPSSFTTPFAATALGG